MKAVALVADNDDDDAVVAVEMIKRNSYEYRVSNMFLKCRIWKNKCLFNHGRSDELGSGPNWKKIARFKILESSSLYFQNDLAFLGRIGKPSLSEFPEIYGLFNHLFLGAEHFFDILPQ